MTYVLDNMRFREGYLLRNVSQRGVMANVKPTYDELQKFHSARIKDKRDEDSADEEDAAEGVRQDVQKVRPPDDCD